MRGKKGIFGYDSGVGRRVTQSVTDWFEVSSFLVRSDHVLEDDEEEKPRFLLGKAIILIIACLLTFRLLNLQITQGSANRYLAEGNRMRRQITVAPRGSIVDRQGMSLVMNEPGYNLEVVPSELPRKKADRQTVYDQISQMAHLDKETIAKAVEGAGLTALDPVTLQPNIEREQALIYKVKLATLPGVRVSFQPSRRYDDTPGLAHIIGYTARMNDQDLDNHPDYHRGSPIGRSGVEASYDTTLRGKVGVSEIEVNANGQFQRAMQNTPPQVGKTLHLTLDKGLQTEMATALKEAMEKNGAKQAVGIAMNPRDGGILASVSLPNYDNNIFAKGISSDDYEGFMKDPDKPLLNRAVDGLYPAGSTIKPFVATAALQEGTINAGTKLDTSAGVIEIGQWKFPDWKVHGITDVRQAIAESNDIFFYALGGGWGNISGLGVDRLKKYFHLFGFGQSTELDYTSDQNGLLPDPDWKKRAKKETWYIGDTYHISIGQGDLLVTPLQLARALSSLVNGARLVTPHIVSSTELPESNKNEAINFSDKKIALNHDAVRIVQEGMRRTVDSETGSARALRSLPFSSAGKTGTAQFGTEEKTHAWYMGYAPNENPEIVVVVIVEGGGEGNAISVPVAGRVFSHYMSHK